MTPTQIGFPANRQSSIKIVAKIVAILTSATLFILVWTYLIPHPELSQFKINEPFIDKAEQPYYAEGFVTYGLTPKAHAATIYALGKELIAYWYGGSEEGARDVQIFQANFSDGQWSDARAVVNTDKVQRDLGRFIRKIGNPAVYNRPDGRTWLFFVSVSVGGWAGSSVNLIESYDGGETWGKVRRLITSPFFNLSTLVRNSPIVYTDGSIGLPVYHEFLGKFGEILRIAPSGRILSKLRLSRGSYSLQPDIVPTSEMAAIGLMRYAGNPPKRLLQFKTVDGGNSWSAPVKLQVPNPNAAVDAIHIGDGRILAAINNTSSSRASFHLAIVSKDQDWNIVHELESEEVGAANFRYQFSYPSITRNNDGMYHLVYSWNTQRIKHVQFNQAWLNQKIMMAGHSASDESPL